MARLCNGSEIIELMLDIQKEVATLRRESDLDVVDYADRMLTLHCAAKGVKKILVFEKVFKP